MSEGDDTTLRSLELARTATVDARGAEVGALSDGFSATAASESGVRLSEDQLATGFVLAPTTASARYRLGALLGRGQQGVVHLAEDLVLRRRVAMKLVSASAATDASAVARFVAEAQLTAQLEHPHIVPIHDAGRWSDGRPFYTMPLLSGRSLAERLQSVREGVADEPLVRLVRWFSSACMAVHAAHEAGVVHRDLKPGNLVIGPSGELLVADFGLARLYRAGVVSTDHVLLGTLAGTPLGTPYYMPPEQARGDHARTTPASDVYALGAILYELLTLRPPFLARSFGELILSILESPPLDPREASPERDVPRDLAELALRCLAKDPSDRPASAAELVEALDGWLGGRFEAERRAREIEKLLAHATSAREESLALAATVRERRHAFEERRLATPEHAPLDQKEPLWADEEALATAERAHEEHEAAAIAALEAALRLRVDAEVAARLVELHLERRRRFLATGRRERALEEERRARIVGGDSAARRLDAPGEVLVEGPDELELARYVDHAGRLLLEQARPLRSGAPVAIEPGSYRVTYARGPRTVALPFVIEPGRALRLWFDPSPLTWLPDDLVLVHGGSTQVGGDEGHARVVDVASFALATLPVTCGEFLEFLRSAFARPEDALARAPRPAFDAPSYWHVVDGTIRMPDVDADGDVWDPRFPVFGISALDAEAYLAWRSARDGRRYRLPTELEWERAARGADGRAHPWGERFDPALCKMRLSRPGAFAPEPVGAFPTDVSPFGVHDLAGSIAEWTSSAYGDDARARCVKGGAWSTRAHRCAAPFRAMMIEHHVSGDLGFRVACDV